jgi:hypothetical protein
METMTEEATPAEAAEAAPEYAIVELMGHVRHVGRLTEVERFGTKMGRIDVPKGGKFEEGFTSVFFSGGSIYRVTPCDLATVERANWPYEPAGRLTYSEPEIDNEDQDEFADEPSF